jgi:hypothetical protein
MNQGYAACSIRIVLNRVDLARNTIFVSTKVYQSIMLLVPTTTVMSSNLALIVTATCLLLPNTKIFRYFGAWCQFDKI